MRRSWIERDEVGAVGRPRILVAKELDAVEPVAVSRQSSRSMSAGVCEPPVRPGHVEIAVGAKSGRAGWSTPWHTPIRWAPGQVRFHKRFLF